MYFAYEVVFNSSQKLLGALLVKYETMYASFVPSVRFYSVEELNALNPSDCYGFSINDGVFFSDTDCSVTAQDDYMESYYKGYSYRHQTDVVDILSWAIDKNACIIPKYEEGNRDIIIPVLKFRVSETTMNIYAPYKLEDGTYRTCSLLNSNDINDSVFYMGIPIEEDGCFPNDMITKVESDFVHDSCTYNIYKVKPKFDSTHLYLHDAFTNFCAANVAFYHIGLKALNTIYRTYLPQEKQPVSTPSEHRARKPRGENILIRHCYYTASRFSEVLVCLNKQDALENEFKYHPESRFIYEWISQTFKRASAFVECTANKDQTSALVSACASMFNECTTKLLMYSLRLLSIRVSLLEEGPSAAKIIKGGGIYGHSTIEFIPRG